MASPTRLNTATTPSSTTTSYALNMPASVEADELLLAFVTVDNGSGDTMSGWTKIANASNGTQMVGVYAKQAVGGGGDSGTVTGSNLNRLGIVTSIEGWDGVIGNIGVATTTGIDPPSVNPGASRDHLYIPFARTNNTSISTPPTNYTDLSTVSIIFTVIMAIASRQLTAQTENPGTFNGSASSAVCGTLSIRPGNFGLVTTHQGAATLAADTTLTAAGTPIRPGAATLAATSTLTADAARVQSAAATVAVDSTLTAAGTRVHPAAASLPAEVTLTAAGSLLAPAADLFATSTLTATAVVTRTGAAAAMVAETTLTVDTSSTQNADAALAAEATLTATATRVHQASASLAVESGLLAGTSAVALASASMTVTSSMVAEAFIPTAKPIEFRDMAVSITPPNGHFKPVPLLLGASWRPNDIRILIVSAYGAGQGGVHQPLPMDPPLPPGWTAAYDLSSGNETKGVFWRRLQAGDQATSVAWAKPPSWGNFLFVTLTARGVDPGADLIAGTFPIAHQNGTTVATTSSVSFPTDGSMLFCVATIPDPGSSAWPNWPSAMGVPIGWDPLTASDNSGANFDGFNADPNVLVVGKSYPAAGSTGETQIPVAIGRPAFISMYVFLRPAPDVTISVGAA